MHAIRLLWCGDTSVQKLDLAGRAIGYLTESGLRCVDTEHSLASSYCVTADILSKTSLKRIKLVARETKEELQILLRARMCHQSPPARVWVVAGAPYQAGQKKTCRARMKRRDSLWGGSRSRGRGAYDGTTDPHLGLNIAEHSPAWSSPRSPSLPAAPPRSPEKM